MKYKLFSLTACCLLFVVLSNLLPARSAYASSSPESLSFNQVLEKILLTYPSLVIARRQTEIARYELDKVESQLGWSFTADAGLKHDLSAFGTPTDQANINAGLERTLASGNRLSLSGNYTYEDNSLVFSPVLPNPSHTTRLDLSLRMPLSQGSDNAIYHESMNSAKAGLVIQSNNELITRDAIASQTLELFYAAAQTRVRISNAELAISRANRLKKYISDNFSLGLTEDKDTLQAEAQLQLQITEKRRLLVAWEQQRTSLNRLMGREWDEEFSPLVDSSLRIPEWDLAALYTEAELYSPDVALNVALLKQAEAELNLKRDSRKSQTDLVFSVGSRTSSGSNSNGDVSEEDLAGQLRLEYRESLDKRGLDAELHQAQLKRRVALEKIRLVKDELRYTLSSLVGQIKASALGLQSARRRMVAEWRKHTDALKRYKKGRLDTDRLIQFENELQQSVVAVKEQSIKLSSLQQHLALLRGRLWQDVRLVE